MSTTEKDNYYFNLDNEKKKNYFKLAEISVYK